MDSLKKVSLQTLYQLIGKAFSSLSTVATIYLISRTFGVEKVGVFTMVLVYLSFFYLAVDFGINAHIMPKLIFDKKELQWRRLLGFRLVLGVLLVAVGAILSGYLPFKDKDFTSMVWVGLFSVIPSAVFISSNAFFQSRLLYNLSVGASTLSSIISLFILWLFISLNLPFSTLIYPTVIGWVVCALVALFFVSKSMKNISPIFDLRFSLDILKDSWPITLTLLANMLYFRVDAFILTSVKSFSEAGIYNLAYQIFQSALVIPTFIMNGYYPLMIRDLGLNKQKFMKEFKLASLAMLLIGVLGIIATFWLGKYVILITGGSEFLPSSTALNILALGFPAFFLSSLFMWALVVFQNYRKMLAIYVLALVINIILNLIFIPLHGFVGAAAVTTFCEYLILILQLIILYPLLK